MPAVLANVMTTSGAVTVERPAVLAAVIAAASESLASPVETFASVWRVKLHVSPGVEPLITCRKSATVYLLGPEEGLLYHTVASMVAPLAVPEPANAVRALATAAGLAHALDAHAGRMISAEIMYER